MRLGSGRGSIASAHAHVCIVHLRFSIVNKAIPIRVHCIEVCCDSV